MPEYQVFHQQAVKSFSAGEDNEHQRRWTESQWEAKASNKKFNYDKSRAHLNFEIVKGGKIVPLGSSKPILERFQDRLEAKTTRPSYWSSTRRKRQPTWLCRQEPH